MPLWAYLVGDKAIGLFLVVWLFSVTEDLSSTKLPQRHTLLNGSLKYKDATRSQCVGIAISLKVLKMSLCYKYSIL